MKLARFTPIIKHIEEPTVEIGNSIQFPEPKMGWTLVGPSDGKDSGYEINLGIIGDSKSIESAKNLIEKFRTVTKGKDSNLLHVDFPGTERLRIKFSIQCTAEISEKELVQLDNTASFSERVGISAKIIQDKIKSLVEREPSPDLLILAYPKKIDEYCIEQAVGNKSSPRKTSLEKYIERQRAKYVPLDTFMGITPPILRYNPLDLRSIVKIECMKHDIPIQIIRPTTTEPYSSEKPKREDDATSFWNLVVAMFYKSNNIPWRVKGLMDDTCYIGITFFRERGDPANMKTALAQIFSLNTEGYVIKGEHAKIDEKRVAHVSGPNASEIIQKAIEVYKRHNDDVLPKRIVIHKTSRFNEEELEGFRAGAEDITKLDLLAFGTRTFKLIRWGTHPPIRGTMVRLPDSSILLYTSGFIPYLDVYPGPRVPSPLEILEHHGTTDIDIIGREILALTKLNWNNAKFSTKAPITIGFSRMVAGILRELPPDFDPKNIGSKFKFYM